MAVKHALEAISQLCLYAVRTDDKKKSQHKLKEFFDGIQDLAKKKDVLSWSAFNDEAAKLQQSIDGADCHGIRELDFSEKLWFALRNLLSRVFVFEILVGVVGIDTSK